jgi:hypothetical protein
MVQKFYAVERQKIITLKGGAKPGRPKSWSHDDDLAAHKGQKIIVSFLDGAESYYTLVDADRFALKLRHPQEDGAQSTVTVYKHAISAYSFPTE